MKKLIFIVTALILTQGCEYEVLEPNIIDQLTSDNFWKTKEDARRGLLYQYSWTQGAGGFNASGWTQSIDAMAGDVVGVRADWQREENLNYWPYSYTGNNDIFLTDCRFGGPMGPLQNAVRLNRVIYELQKMGNDVIDNQTRSQYIAEARALRAFYYYIIYDFWGPYVLELEPIPDINILKSRATEEEFTDFIINECKEAFKDIPASNQIGRLDKGSTLMTMLKTYLIMTRYVGKQHWQDVADVAKQIMELNKYVLLDNYASIWGLANEGNKEIIYAVSKTTADGNRYQSRNLPSKWYSINGVTHTSLWNVSRVPWKVYDSFDPLDVRKQTMLEYYWANLGGGVIKFISLRDPVAAGGEGPNCRGAIMYKYTEDPNGIAMNQNQDIVVWRYADVLLIRAEALNELNGPTQESFDLINQVRARAGLDGISMAKFGTKEALRERILQERQWELCFEVVRRQDLIRHGVFVEEAYKRGASNVKSPNDTHLERLPIPQGLIDLNPENIQQNPGYN